MAQVDVHVHASRAGIIANARAHARARSSCLHLPTPLPTATITSSVGAGEIQLGGDLHAQLSSLHLPISTADVDLIATQLPLLVKSSSWYRWQFLLLNDHAKQSIVVIHANLTSSFVSLG